MQQTRFALSVVALLLLRHAGAQAPVDLSGVWQMDASRSESAHQAVPIGPVTMTIKQSPAAIAIETRRAQKDKSPASTETLTFKLDGSEDSVVGNAGATVKAKAHWDGAKLVTETARNIQGSTVTTMQVFSLDPSGKELTVDKTLTVQHGYQFPGAHNTGTGKDVFIKRKGSDKK
jgi:hypothetical protein